MPQPHSLLSRPVRVRGPLRASILFLLREGWTVDRLEKLLEKMDE